MRLAAVLLGLWAVLAAPVQAQEFSALARLDPLASRLVAEEGAVVIELALSQPVPWRVRFLADPPRLVLDTREVAFTPADLSRLGRAGVLPELRAGRFRPGWSRLVAELDGPYRLTLAEMRGSTEGPALLRLRLEPGSAGAFAEAAARPDPEGWSLPRPAPVEAPRPRQRGDRDLVVVLDPGHGGLDPGAEHGGQTEAALMLTFAHELREALLRAGGFQVVLTREADIFVPLETRIAIAHQSGADLFLSLHADAVAEGVATGATVYTLAEAATDAASAALAERHDRDSLLSGVDLTGQDDLIASVLMDLARVETAARTERLAEALVTAIKGAEIRMHRTPRRAAAFSVLKAPDIPSVLLELGYMSSERDRARLNDPEWRARMAVAVVAAVQGWAVGDAAEAGLLRQ